MVQLKGTSQAPLEVARVFRNVEMSLLKQALPLFKDRGARPCNTIYKSYTQF